MIILSKTALAALKASIKYQTNVSEDDIKQIKKLFDQAIEYVIDHEIFFIRAYCYLGCHQHPTWTEYVTKARKMLFNELVKSGKLLKDKNKFIRRKNAIEVVYKDIVNKIESIEDEKTKLLLKDFLFETNYKPAPTLECLINLFEAAYKSKHNN